MPKGIPLEARLKSERYAFLEEMGLDGSIVEGYGISEMLIDVELMRESFGFFSNLGADIGKTYRDYPRLLGYSKESLNQKLQFLTGEIGISRRTVARLPELFTYSLDSMRDKYQHYADEFGGNSEQAKALLRGVPTIFGNKTALIDDRIRRYREVGIDFHGNYILLVIDPEKAIDTRDYLTSLGIKEPETGKWYHMLLTVSRRSLEPKVEYCIREGIKWELHPNILVLGLGSDKKKGALRRRVEIIKKGFPNGLLPRRFDYQNRPQILDSSVSRHDAILKKRISDYKSK